MADFVGDWLDCSRDSLSRLYPAFEAFDAGYTPRTPFSTVSARLGSERGVKFDAAGFAVSEPGHAGPAQSPAAQRLFGTGAYFRVVNPALSPAYARALSILEAWDELGAPVLEP